MSSWARESRDLMRLWCSRPDILESIALSPEKRPGLEMILSELREAQAMHMLNRKTVGRNFVLVQQTIDALDKSLRGTADGRAF